MKNKKSNNRNPKIEGSSKQIQTTSFDEFEKKLEAAFPSRQWMKKNFKVLFGGTFLSLASLIFTVYVYYKPAFDNFSATVQVYGWEGEQHKPLTNKGKIVLILDNKEEFADINTDGKAVFTGIPSKFNGKTLPVLLKDTENEPYYLTDSLVTIRKDEITKVQVLLHGLERLQGRIIDNISSEGLPDVSVTVAGISATTDKQGYFGIDIPLNRQKQEQKIVISKDGYKEIAETVSMTGEYNVVLERK